MKIYRLSSTVQVHYRCKCMLPDLLNKLLKPGIHRRCKFFCSIRSTWKIRCQSFCQCGRKPLYTGEKASPGLQRICKKLQNLLPGDFSKWDLFLGRGIFIKLSRQDLAGPVDIYGNMFDAVDDFAAGHVR